MAFFILMMTVQARANKMKKAKPIDGDSHNDKLEISRADFDAQLKNAYSRGYQAGQKGRSKKELDHGRNLAREKFRRDVFIATAAGLISESKNNSWTIHGESPKTFDGYLEMANLAATKAIKYF